MLSLAAGRFDEAELAAERARALGDSGDTLLDAGVYGLQMFAIRREQGRLAEVLPLMRALSTHSGDQPVWRPGLTALYAELGMFDESRRELTVLGPDGFAAVPRDSVWPACLTFLAEACIACGAAEHAATLLDELDGFAGRNLMVAMTICFGPADRLRGGLAHLLGRDDEAEQHFRAAMVLADRSASPVWRAHVQHDWSVRRGGDRRRGDGQLASLTRHRRPPRPSGCRRWPSRPRALIEHAVPAPVVPVTYDGMSRARARRAEPDRRGLLEP